MLEHVKNTLFFPPPGQAKVVARQKYSKSTREQGPLRSISWTSRARVPDPVKEDAW